ncbi:MAG: hypothetical protein QMD46_06070 [Methanomicrobiales archaeon]|nr:hypothetical protein [Methanomicrobiales archaeon]MDI6876166.1 hypothetical protein [Methanomicrobiales archaeon]
MAGRAGALFSPGATDPAARSAEGWIVLAPRPGADHLSPGPRTSAVAGRAIVRAGIAAGAACHTRWRHTGGITAIRAP